MTARRALLALTLAALGGCVHEQMVDAQPSIAATSAARLFEMVPLAVGRVVTDPADAPFDRSINIRGSTMSPPGKRFSTYLREVLIAELRAIGREDPASRTILSAELIENRARENFKNGGGIERARFHVMRDGVAVYDKVITAEVDWPSSFVGAIAIMNAFRAHSSLSNQLVAKLFADPDFQRAVKPR